MLMLRGEFFTVSQQAFMRIFESDTSDQQTSKVLVFASENGRKITHGLFLAHVLRVRMVVHRILTDPHLYLTHLILANHSFSDLYWPMNAYQPSQSLQGSYHTLSPPRQHRSYAISVYVHLPKITQVLMLGRVAGSRMEVKQSAYMRVMVVHAGGEEGGFAWEVLEQDAQVVALQLFPGYPMHHDSGFALQSQPILGEQRSRVHQLRVRLTHQYNMPILTNSITHLTLTSKTEVGVSLHACEFVQLQMCLFEFYPDRDELILQLHNNSILDLLPFRWHSFSLLSHLPQQSLQTQQLILALTHQLSISLLILQHVPHSEILFIDSKQFHLECGQFSCIMFVIFFEVTCVMLWRLKRWPLHGFLQQQMSLFRRAEVSLMSFLFSNRTVRLAKKRTEFFRRVAISGALCLLWYQCEYKVDRLIKVNEEIKKPQSFMIDGKDPFSMSEKEWELIQNHYLSFYYR